MLARVETLQRTGAQQGNYFQNFDERLQRLEDMQTSTIQLLNVLVQNMQTSNNNQRPLNESASSKVSEKKTDDDEIFNFTALSSPDDVTLPISSLLSSSGGRVMRSGSFTGRKPTNPLPIPSSAPPQIVVGTYPEFLNIKNSTAGTLTGNDERLPLGATGLSASTSSINTVDDTNHQSLHAAEETEHNIFGKLIKERFRKLSEVVEDIERTLPSHQQRHDDKREKCDTTDDEEVLSTMDWVDTTGRTANNSTRVSRYDINQEENGITFLPTSKKSLMRRK
jgi:hypothetical protein